MHYGFDILILLMELFISNHEPSILFQEIPVGGDGKGDAVYEKDVAIHGDVLLHKFKKRISRSPHQILRYVFK